MNTVDLESNNAGIMTTYKTHYTKEQLFELSEKGNSDAMYSIGYRYLKGMGGLPQNNDLALEWFKKAADAGNRSRDRARPRRARARCRETSVRRRRACRGGLQGAL